MSQKCKLLIILGSIDSLASGWFCVWFFKVFIIMISPEFMSVNNGLQAGLTLLCTLLVVKKMKSSVSLQKLYVVWIVSYCSLFWLLVSPTAFLLCSTVVGASYSALTTVFKNNLLALNVANSERALFDNYSFIVRKCFNLCGCGMAYISILPSVPYFVVWLGMFAIFDLDLIITIFMIKKKVFILP